MPAVRAINSAQPYETYDEYLRKGWVCPLPLFPRAKEKPPTGYTGYHAKVPNEDNFEAWLDHADYGPTANIAIRLHEIGVNKIRKQIIGIDVDDYTELGGKGRVKSGGADLEALEQELGPLPATVVSSARPYPSGIRLFLAPAGIRFHDKPSPSIEIIQKHHRYIVGYPSWNPDAQEQYLWLREDRLDKAIRETMGIPDVWKDLSDLPVEWVDFLSSNRTLVDIDMKVDSSTVEDLVRWTEDTFPQGYPCEQMRKVLGYWKKQIDGNPSSHDKITKAHWALTGDALNGHRGWHQAIGEIDRYWSRDVADRDKRDFSGLRGELFRSQTGNLRKRKASVESGETKPKRVCLCPNEAQMAERFAKRFFGSEATDGVGGRIIPAKSGTAKAGPVAQDMSSAERSDGSTDPEPSDNLGEVEVGELNLLFSGRSPGEYEQNDDGNAEHFLELYRSDVLFVPEWEKWAIWDGSLWTTDEGNAHRAFRMVKRRQIRFAEDLYGVRDDVYESFRLDGLEEAEIKKQGEYKAAAARAKSWSEWATRSGNVMQVKRALETASLYPDITKSAREFDADVRALGVRNGAIILGDHGVEYRERKREDYITMAVPHNYVPLAEQPEHPDMVQGLEMLHNYLDQFIPDLELRAHLQMVLGYGMLGHNPLRIAVFIQSDETGTGKSTLANLVAAAMGRKENGGYCASINASLFREAQLNAQLADVLDSRFVVTSELSEDNYLHADVFKRLVSVDEVSAEKKYANEQIRRKASFIPIIATNGAPTIKGADSAVDFRMYVVPFDHKIAGRDDPEYPIRLERLSGPAMFAWMVEGYEKYVADPGAIVDRDRWPAAIKTRKKEFRGDLNPLNGFVNECLVKAPGKDTPAVDVFAKWTSWCVENNVKEDLSYPMFCRKLSANGLKSVRRRFVAGLAPERRFLDTRLRNPGSGRTNTTIKLNPDVKS